MSCNGCRVLRKGCSDSCILRPCLQWIESAEAQGHATVFLAKFFGRAGLMSFITAVPDDQRPALFQSLLYEACGRTVNPVLGAVGLLSSGNWSVCQAAVDTVLRGGLLKVSTSSSSSSTSKCKVPHTLPASSPQAQAPAPCSTQLPCDSHPCPSLPPFPFPSSISPSYVDSRTSSSPLCKKAKLSDTSNQNSDNIAAPNVTPTIATLSPTVHDEGGKLIVPVPRRLMPNHRLISLIQDDQRDDPVQHHHQPQEADISNRRIELGLALNLDLHGNHGGSRVDHTWKVSLVRMGSPSSNSESSVTSIEVPVRTSMPQQEQQLLHLLL